MKSKLIVAAIIVSLLLGANPSYAASGGRISSGGFRSSPSRTSTPSYRPSTPSYRPSAPSAPSAPSYRPSTPSYRPSAPSYPLPYPSAQPYREPSRVVVPVPVPVYTAPREMDVIVVPAPVPAPAPSPVETPVPSTVTPSPVPAPVRSTVATPTPSAKADSQAQENFAKFIILLGGVLMGGFIVYSLRPQNNGEASEGIKVARVRVALLASARDIQEDLERLAQDGDTESNEGLTTILQETSLALMRHPDLIAYASADSYSGNEGEMESLYGRLTMEERSKVSEEVLSNVGGRVSKSSHNGKNVSNSNEYILVSLLVATDSPLNTGSINNVEGLRKSLVALGSILPDNLMALEVIWQPEGDDEVLTKEELLSLYPDLVSL